MERYVELLTAFLEKTGAPGAIIAALIVGLGLLVIVYGRTRGIFDDTRTAGLKSDFIEKLMTRVDNLEAREAELHRDLERNEAENDRLKDRQRELQTQVSLMRNQLRRAIDLLRAVREGRLAPGAIEVADTVEVA